VIELNKKEGCKAVIAAASKPIDNNHQDALAVTIKN